MPWNVGFTNKASKQYSKLSNKLKDITDLLVRDLEQKGPIRGEWKNYSKLGNNRHHCHLKSGKPTYVACWELQNKTIRIIEVYYVGTHEQAPY